MCILYVISVGYVSTMWMTCMCDMCVTLQGWLTEDQATVLLDDEVDETQNLVEKWRFAIFLMRFQDYKIALISTNASLSTVPQPYTQ